MATQDDFAWMDATAQAELVRKKEVQPIELVEAAIARIERLNPTLNAVVTPMFELARGYKDRGMSAYSELQQAEFASEEHGYTATRHQREVGTGYFDQVAQVVSGGEASTLALAKSTEAEQFH